MKAVLLSRRLQWVAAGTVLVLAATLLGGIAAGRSSSTRSEERPAASSRERTEGMAVLEQLGIATASSSGGIDELEQQARADGTAPAFARLGLAHLQAVRETGDPGGYRRADAALSRALELDGASYAARVGLATLAAARHEFETALDHAERAVELQPGSIEALGIRGDAELELGRYADAFATFDEMAARKPSLAAYSRISYGRQLIGDRAGAIEAMGLAIDAGSGVREHVAFALVQRGHLYLSDDSRARASADYAAALRLVPSYAPAIAGQARIAYAAGDVEGARRLYDRAISVVPLPEYAISLADMLRAEGRAPEAREAERLVDGLAELQRANGVAVDLELALHQLDRGTDPAGALRTVEEIRRTRRSVDVDDALAWALFRNGRCEEALVASRRALRLGSIDAVKLFHRAEIERCLGRPGTARSWYRRAVTSDPHFSPIFAPIARARAAA